MNTTLSLLALPHEMALSMMIQDAVRPGVSAQALQLGTSGYLSNNRIATGIFLKPETYDDPTWPYRGQVEFVHKRMDIADFFTGIDLAFRMPNGFTSSQLITKLSSIFRIVFEDSDYYHDTFTSDALTYQITLRMSPASKRWSGSVTISITNSELDDVTFYGDQNGNVYVDQAGVAYGPGS